MTKCESCGMPLEEDTTSKFNQKYCTYCQDQQSGALKSKEEVRAGSIQAAVQLMGKTQEEAEKMVDETMPTLPRWQTQE